MHSVVASKDQVVSPDVKGVSVFDMFSWETEHLQKLETSCSETFLKVMIFSSSFNGVSPNILSLKGA